VVDIVYMVGIITELRANLVQQLSDVNGGCPVIN
jgi:hypothetical protein